MKNKISLILGILAAQGAFAQGTETATTEGMSTPLLWIIYLVIGLLVTIVYLLFLVSKELKKYVADGNLSESAQMWDNRSVWEKIFQIKPVGTDKDVLIDEPHDGIYELDNPPPPWFMVLFYGSILTAFLYFMYFLGTNYGMTQEQEYAATMDAAKTEQAAAIKDGGAVVDESTVVALTDATAIAAGKKVYIQNCKVCHAEGGKGSVGPNLTDEFWKHGGGIKNVFKTIKHGVVEKGMMAWDGTLSPAKIQEVSSYILSLQGTNPEGAKAAEGEKWEEAESAESADEAGSGAVAFSDDDVAAGKKVYIKNCKVCHDKGGKGSVGPNLTDEFWKNGGGVENIAKSIDEGIAGTAMMAWKEMLSDDERHVVTGYILSLQGTNPEGAKEAEGDKWVAP